MRSLLVFALLAAAVVTGYAWYRSGISDAARGDLRISPPGQPHLVPWPHRHWRYGPESDGSSQHFAPSPQH